ncbi:MAG: ABC transporter permease [Chlamydiae bacterium]|jgi:oligopeptide transport system permease protein|nr:ABC transporter permease [Chlamydiota bacterium]
MNPTQDIFIKLPEEEKTISMASERPLSHSRIFYQKLTENPLTIIGFALLSLILFLALFGPMLTSHTYYETQLALKNTAPCKEFWFGTDELGRDLFCRACWGARISLFVGITAASIDLIIGVIYGAFAGYLGGKVENAMMRLIDILASIPSLLFVILLLVIMQPGILSLVIALTVTGWISMARIVRGQILQLKQLDFVKAATALGASHQRIIFTHLLPNLTGPIITTMTLTIPSAIFAEAFLSFLGLGVQAPIASWGTMASDGLAAMRYYPWRLFFPAACISLTMLSFHLLGDGVSDAFDPRMQL